MTNQPPPAAGVKRVNLSQPQHIGMHMPRKAYSYPYMFFMLVFIVTPLVLILINAFLDDDTKRVTLQNFIVFFSDSTGLSVLGNSLLVGIVTTAICFVLGYFAAYFLAKYHAKNRVLVLLFILPMWINFLIRTLSTRALFVALDIKLGMGTVLFGMVYNYLPFMILPLHTTITAIDKSYIEAAADLGATPVQTFFKTILPLSVPGIISGITMVFIPTISTFAISELLSNRQVYLFGDAIQTRFSMNLYGVGSVMSLVMLVLVMLSNVLLSRVDKNEVNIKGGGLL